MATLQILFAEYITPLEHAAPIDGSLFLTELDTDTDPDSKNDLRFLIPFSENVTGLTPSDITIEVSVPDSDITEQPSIVSLKGKNATYELVVRPPIPLSTTEDDFSETLTIRIGSNAVDQGNLETEVVFDYSNTLPEAAWQPVFTAPNDYEDIVGIRKDRVILMRDNDVDFFSRAGSLVSSETLTFGDPPDIDVMLRYAHDLYLALDTATEKGYLLNASGSTEWESADDVFRLGSTAIHDWTIDAIQGRLYVTADDMNPVRYLPMPEIHTAIQKAEDLSDATFSDYSFDNGDITVEDWTQPLRIATDAGRLYLATRETEDNFIYAYGAGGALIPASRFLLSDNDTDAIFVFENHLYRLSGSRLTRLDLSTGDLPHARTEIYPQVVFAGDRIDLQKFARGAKDIIFEVGFDQLDWIRLSENRYLDIAADAISGRTALIRLRAINQNGATLENTFFFYIQIHAARVPDWKDFQAINMVASQKLNMFTYCEDADMISWQHGFTVPTDIDLTDGVLSITGTGYDTENTIKLRAKNLQGGFADIEFTLNIFPLDRLSGFEIDTAFRFKVYVDGIAVPDSDILNTSNINASLDSLRVNAYKTGQATVNLKSEGGYYNSEFADNFWSENDLNRNGYLNSIAIYLETLESSGWASQGTLFEGFINQWMESLNAVQVTLICIDNTYHLRQTTLAGAGLGKPVKAMVYAPDDTAEAVREGQYTPETSLTPLNVDVDASAYAHDRAIALKSVMNRPEGVLVDRTGYLTDSDLKTQGGYIEDVPALLIDFRTQHRQRQVSWIADALAKVGQVYSVDTDFGGVSETDHISVSGNLAFATETGRILRYPVDWIHDATNDRLYVLLSNPSDAIRDQLIVYHRTTDISCVLQEFDASLRLMQLASSDFDTFYILATQATGAEVDKSRKPSDTDTQSLTLGYDASERATSSIWKYTHTADHLALHVATDADYPPQVGIHFWIGFDAEDAVWKGIQPTSRAGFKVYNDSLYYRFATSTEFGVASVDTDGTITEQVKASKQNYQNPLNFAFDVDAAGEVYWAYSEGTLSESKLIIKDTSSTLLTEDEGVGNLTVLDTEGGAFLGCHEMIVSGSDLYLIVPVMRRGREINRSAGSVVYRFTGGVLNTLATYDFVHWGATSLVEHDAAVYFLESPVASYKFPAKNDLLDTWDAETEQNVIPNAKGFLNKVVGNSVESLGNVYFDRNAFRGTHMLPLSFDDALHFVFVDGDPDTILQRDARVSTPESFQWLTFGKQLNYRLDVPTSGSLYNALVDIATKTNSTFVMDAGIVCIRSRTVLGALLNGALTQTSTTIGYDTASGTFPDSGYVLIDDEIIGYTTKTSTQLSVLTRGVQGTDAAAHADNAEMLSLHSVVSYRQVSGNVEMALHWEQLYNTLQDAQRTIDIKDDVSRDTYGERILDLGLGLNDHQIVWQEFVAEQYLEKFKDVQHLFKIDLRPSFHIRLSDVIGFFYSKDVMIPIQVIDITKSTEGTRIVGRQVQANIRATDAVATTVEQKALDGAGNAIADGAGNVLVVIVPRFEFPTGVAIADQTWTQFQEITPVQLPLVEVEGEGDVVYSLIDVPAGIYIDHRNRMAGIPQTSQSATEGTYRATDGEGNTIDLTFDATVTAVTVESQKALDGAGNAIADGAGNVIITVAC